MTAAEQFIEQERQQREQQEKQLMLLDMLFGEWPDATIAQDPEAALAEVEAVVMRLLSAAEAAVERQRQEGEIVTAGKQPIAPELQEPWQDLMLLDLRRRFGALPDALIARIKAADVDELELLIEPVLWASTLADVLAFLWPERGCAPGCAT